MVVQDWAVPDRAALTVFPPEGFLRHYIDYVSQSTDAPIIYHLGTALSALSLCSAKTDIKILPAEGGCRYQKLSIVMWSVIVGRSGDRKSHAMRRGVNLAKRACATVPDRAQCILPSDGSIEGWTQFLSESPMGLFYRTELSSLLDQSRRGYQEGLKSWLMTLYEDEDFTRITLKDGEMVVERPRVNVLGAIPPDTFKQKTNIGDWHSGYLARHLFFAGSREWLNDIPVTDDAEEMKLARWLSEVPLHTEGWIVVPGKVMQQAYDWSKEKVETLRGIIDDALYSHLARYQEQAYRIAALYAVSRQMAPQPDEEGEIEVNAEDMEYTLQALDLLKNSAMSLYATMQENYERSEEDEILAVLEQNPQGLTVQEIRKLLPKIPLRIIRSHLKDMEIECMTKKSQTGRGAPNKLYLVSMK